MKRADLGDNGRPTPAAATSPQFAASRGLAVSVLSSESDLGMLRSEWNRLATAHPVSSAFLSHEWADAAWQWRRRDADLALLTVRRESSELVGIAPLVRTTGRESGIFSRRLEFLSVPDNQFADILFAPAHLTGVAQAVAQWLRTHSRRWDQITLRALHHASPSVPAMTDALRQAGLSVARQAEATNYSIDLRGTWEAYYRTRSRRLKKGNNLAANHLQRAGKLKLTWLRGKEVNEHTGDIVRNLSAASWKHSTGTTLDQPGPKAFFDRLLEHAREQRWLSVWLLTLDELPVAAELQLEHEGCMHGLRADFRTDLGELSPGTYLNWKIIEGLFDQGLDVYYLGPGENPYKRRWTDTGTSLARLDAWSPSLRGRALAATQQWLRPGLRTARDRVRNLYHRACRS